MHYGFFDGACQGNPGPIGLGVSICNHEKEIALGAGPVGHGTNNDAEYLAVIKLLESAIAMGIKELVVTGDSQLIINQINGKWQAGQKFKPLLSKVHSLASHFKDIHFQWIAREKNKRADQLSKRGLALNEWHFMIKEQDGAAKPEVTSKPNGSISVSDKTTQETVNRQEIRVGEKFAVIVGDACTVMIDLRLNRCSCGKSDCEHKRLIKELKSDRPTTD